LVKGSGVQFYLPWAIPSMISLMAFKNVFQLEGPANELLRMLKVGGEFADFLHFIGLSGSHDFPISWLTIPANGALARVIVLLVNLWLGWPYHMMLITGVLASISAELYEAADIDGANGWQRFRHITLHKF
jgi:arabinogalactan oligomer/maltooligosaccharide transport system permease protein